MGKVTMIRFEPLKEGSERHNKREKELDYVRKDLSALNNYWESDTQAHVIETDKALVKQRTGRSMQKKATPVQEAVVAISEDTTMNDLHRLADNLEKRFGIHCFQIAIHKDEGHWRNGMWLPNLHAHMVFNWVLSTGRSFRPKRQQLSEAQDITAESLHMQRGKSSNVKHLNAIQYKNKQEEERQRELQKSVKAKAAEAASKALEWLLRRPSASQKELKALREAMPQILANEREKGKKEVLKQLSRSGSMYNTHRDFKSIDQVASYMSTLEARAAQTSSSRSDAEYWRQSYSDASSRLSKYEGREQSSEKPKGPTLRL